MPLDLNTVHCCNRTKLLLPTTTSLLVTSRNSNPDNQDGYPELLSSKKKERLWNNTSAESTRKTRSSKSASKKEMSRSTDSIHSFLKSRNGNKSTRSLRLKTKDFNSLSVISTNKLLSKDKTSKKEMSRSSDLMLFFLKSRNGNKSGRSLRLRIRDSNTSSTILTNKSLSREITMNSRSEI